MSTIAPDIVAARTGFLALARLVTGLLAGSLLGGVVFLVISNQGLQRGATDLQFARSVGILRGYTGSDIPRQGLYTILEAGVVLGVVLLLAGHLLIRRWWVRAVPLGVVTFTAWALVYAPRGTFAGEAGGERVRLDVGTLGIEAGALTPIVFLLAAAGGAIVAARVSDLMAGADFWKPKDNDIRKGLDELAELGLAEREGDPGDVSLEFSEKRGPEAEQTRGGDT